VVDEILLKRSTQWKAELEPDRRLKVGWAGGTSHLADLLAYDTALQNVLRSNDHIDMHFAGHDLSPILRDQRKRATWSPWLQDVGQHYKVVSSFDIAVAPLDMNISFNRSKSNLRCLESAACGIPVVATDLEPYHDFVIDGKTGFLVKTQEEFEDRLNALIHDDDLRVEMGAAAKELAKEWTVQANFEKWEAAYELCAEGN
jgi:glycosyltransferase involved in cell wall biosynthesis